MRVLVLIFIFYIHNVISDKEKFAAKGYPKKVPGKILVNFGKYANKPITRKPLVTNFAAKDSKYTVFQRISESKKGHNIPESPYFPVDPLVVQKTRVKKVLPDYLWSSMVRNKRSAETSSSPNNETITNIQSTTSKSLVEEKVIINQINKTRRANPENVQHSVTVKAKTEKTNIISNQMKKFVVSKGPNAVKTKPQKKPQVQQPHKKKLNGKQVAKKSNKSRGLARSKTRSKGKVIGRNGTIVKKIIPGAKKVRRSKSKLQQKMKRPTLRLNKSKKKTNVRKSSKKQGARKGKVAKSNIPAETRRLTAAREATIEDYPYVVSIQKDDEHWCSGALLNPRLVITTANCLWKARHISRMEVRAGSSFTDRGGQVADIQEVMKHPRWGLRRNPDNDVALVLLDRNIKFSHSCHAVDLPNRAMFPAFNDAWVASWGAERRDGVFEAAETNLEVYHTMVMSRELCNNITTRFGVIVTDNFICLSQSGRTSPCTRDTGAPAVSDGILWGIASWGLRKLCGTERFPSMFSYIASQSNMDFIMNATSYLMSDHRLSPFPDRPREV